MSSPFTPEQLAELEAAIFAGRKIEAIKRYRELSHLGLKESKEAVEQLEAGLRAKAPEKFAASRGSGCTTTTARAIVLLAFLGTGAWWLARSL